MEMIGTVGMRSSEGSTSRYRLVSVAAVASLLLSLSGCIVTGSEGSRHRIYDSIEGLSADSALVLVGSVASLEIHGDNESAHTTHGFDVKESFPVRALGNTLIAEFPDMEEEIGNSADRLSIRQVGLAGAGPVPSLQSGVEYLLFLTPTGLPEDPPLTFYVTGGVAGIFELRGGEYVSLSRDGDTLQPVTVADLRRAGTRP